MGYVAGQTILDDEYNTFVNSSSDPFGYNHFAGTGSGVYGLGQRIWQLLERVIQLQHLIGTPY